MAPRTDHRGREHMSRKTHRQEPKAGGWHPPLTRGKGPLSLTWHPSQQLQKPEMGTRSLGSPYQSKHRSHPYMLLTGRLMPRSMLLGGHPLLQTVRKEPPFIPGRGNTGWKKDVCRHGTPMAAQGRVTLPWCGGVTGTGGGGFPGLTCNLGATKSQLRRLGRGSLASTPPLANHRGGATMAQGGLHWGWRSAGTHRASQWSCPPQGLYVSSPFPLPLLSPFTGDPGSMGGQDPSVGS